MTREVLYTDGGCTLNDQLDYSRRTMVSVVTDNFGTVVSEVWDHDGGSNNIAEILAIKDAMTYATSINVMQVEIKTDSRVAIAWFKSLKVGKKINNPEYTKMILNDIRNLKERVNAELTWTPRAENLAGIYIEDNLYGI